MNDAVRTLKRILLVTYLIILHIVAVYFVGERILASYTEKVRNETLLRPTKDTELPTPLPVPSLSFNANIPGAITNQTQSTPIPNPGGLIIPVAGVKPEQLTDSYSDARSGGRIHDALDIPAPVGTPVIAVADGEIIKFFDSKLGGITIYQLSADRKFVYYYAHLQRHADDVKVGDIVKQGKTIAFVGDTGNAGAGNYHLHFSIAATTDPKRYWEGTYINPYPLLRNQSKLLPN